MTKFEELEHMDYALDLLGKLPADISIGALYTHLKKEQRALKESITAREQFSHLWYKCTSHTSKRPPCGTPGHAQVSP